MGTLLDKPMTEKETATEKGTDGLEFGVSAMQGWRVDMEDAHTIIANVPELEGHSFVAVFDGHGGAACAHYAGKNMMRHIAETAEFKEYVGSDTKDTKVLEKALYVGFLACDRSVKAEQDESTDGDRSGSTAVAAFVTPKHVVVAHAGDSRAVLASGQEVAFATADHKPYNEGERHRIEKAGGVVSMKRVDGDLAVSRALGDFQYKDEGLAPEDCKVSPAPETKSIERKPEDEFLVVACDGIWDVLSDEDCTQAIREIFVEGESDLGLACEELLDMCLFQGSRDNMSAVLVAFPGLKRESTGEGVKGRRAQREAEDSEADSQNDDDGETAAAAAAAPAPAGGTAPPAAATQGEQATAEATAESK